MPDIDLDASFVIGRYITTERKNVELMLRERGKSRISVVDVQLVWLLQSESYCELWRNDLPVRRFRLFNDREWFLDSMDSNPNWISHQVLLCANDIQDGCSVRAYTNVSVVPYVQLESSQHFNEKSISTDRLILAEVPPSLRLIADDDVKHPIKPVEISRNKIWDSVDQLTANTVQFFKVMHDWCLTSAGTGLEYVEYAKSVCRLGSLDIKSKAQ